jgi:hypothetical protein
MFRQRKATEQSTGKGTAINVVGSHRITADDDARVRVKTGLRGGGCGGQDRGHNAGDENVNMACHGALRRIACFI